MSYGAHLCTHEKVSNIPTAPEYHEADDDTDHGLQNIHLCARQLGASCSSSRWLLSLSSVS